MIKALISILIATSSILSASTEEAVAPTKVYEQFLVALVMNNEKEVKELALAHPDIHILFSNAPMPEQEQENAVRYVKSHPYKVLQPGESFKLPNGKEIQATKELEEQGIVIIYNDIDPLPHLLKKENGFWKVNAGDLIAARKAVLNTSPSQSR